MTKQEAIRLAQLARLTVKGPSKIVKAYQCGAFQDFEYAAILIDSIQKDKNIILIAKKFESHPKGTCEWIIGRALTWALNCRKKEKEFNSQLKDKENQRYQAYLKSKADDDQERMNEKAYGPINDY